MMPANVQDLLSLLLRRRRAALIGGSVTAAIVLAGLLLMPRLYVAEARLLVDSRSNREGIRTDQPTESGGTSLMNTQRDLLLSPGVRAAAIASGVFADNTVYASSGDPVQLLGGRLDVYAPRETWVLIVQLRDEDPRRAERGLQTLIDAFLAVQSKLERDQAESALSFLGHQVDESARTLQAARDEEQDFRIRNRLFTDDSERSSASQRLGNLQGRRVVVREQVANLTTVVGQYDAALAKGDGALPALLAVDAIARNPMVSSLNVRWLDNQAKLAELGQRVLERHPSMIQAREQDAALRDGLLSAAKQVGDGYRGELAATQSQLAGLERTIMQEEEELTKYKEALVRLGATSDRVRNLADIHERLLRRRSEMQVDGRLEAVRVAVADQPQARIKKAGVWTPLAAAIAMFLGMVVAAGTAVIAEARDRRVAGAASLPSGLAVLAKVPFVAHVPTPGSDGPLATVSRALRFNLVTAKPPQEGRGQVWLLVPSSAGAGASTSARHLAAAFASAGLRTLLVDADMSTPGQHLTFQVDPHPGLDALLAGEPDIAPRTVQPNLDLMPCVPPSAPRPDLLAGHCLPEWMEQVRHHYDHIIIDAPPIDTSADGLSLAMQADGVMVVVRDGQTAMAAVQNGHLRLAPVHERVLGALLVEGHG